MNGDIAHHEVKAEPDELNKASAERLPTPSLSTMKSPSPTAGPTAPSVRSSAASMDVPSNISRATPDVQPMNPPLPSVSPSVARNPLASLQSAKRKRLPQDKVGQLEDRIALDARDADAWLALIGEHQAKGKISDARNTYERFFKVFPDLVRFAS
jgi:cleavage stimulation factor subunit 3